MRTNTWNILQTKRGADLGMIAKGEESMKTERLKTPQPPGSLEIGQNRAFQMVTLIGYHCCVRIHIALGIISPVQIVQLATESVLLVIIIHREKERSQ